MAGTEPSIRAMTQEASSSFDWQAIAAEIITWWQEQGGPQASTSLPYYDAPWWDKLDALIDAANQPDAGAAIGALFGGIIEVANDSLSTSGRELYGQVFARAIWRSGQHLPALAEGLKKAEIDLDGEMLRQYMWRKPGPHQTPPEEATHIVILSRVTLGADVLLNSVLIQHLRRAYPEAQISFIGDAKLKGLFSGCEHLDIVPLKYARRGSLGERLTSWLDLRDKVQELNPDLIVSADSRLDQLRLYSRYQMHRIYYGKILPMENQSA